MSWTLEHDGTTQSFEAWGLEGVVFRFQTFGVSTATFRAAEPIFDEAAPFARGDAAIIRFGSTVVFRGRFGPVQRAGRGNESSLSYVVRDVWHDLSTRFYAPMNGFALTSGATVASALEAVITHAASIGVGIQFGTAANLGAELPNIEFRDQTCASMLVQLRRFVPDVATRIDYTTTPPTIHFVRRADASALTLAIDGTDAWDAIDIASLDDLQTTGVYLRYVRQDSDGVAMFADAYPVDVEPSDEGVVLATFDLRGAALEKIKLGTRNISPNAKSWWADKVPWTKEASGGSYVIEDGERLMQDGSGAWVTDTTGSAYEITSGGVPGWINDARPVLVRAVAKNFTLDGEDFTEAKLECSVNATSLAAGLYVRETDAGEVPPSGLAQAVFEATSVLHFEGRISRASAELALPLPHPANVVNLSGGLATTRGWDTMRAVISSIEIDVDNAVQSIAFGPPSHLAIQDFMELARLRGSGREVPQIDADTEGGGQRLGAASNSMPPKPVAVATTPAHPFFIYQASGEMHTGTVNGYIVPKISGAPIGVGGGALTLSGDGWVYLRVRVDLTFHSSTHFLSSWAIQTSGGVPLVEVIGSTTELADGISGDVLTAYKLVAQVLDGVVQMPQALTTNVNFGLCDRSDGTSGGKDVEATWNPA